MLENLLNQLPEYYVLQKFPYHWECFDGYAKCRTQNAVFKGDTIEEVIKNVLKYDQNL